MSAVDRAIVARIERVVGAIAAAVGRASTRVPVAAIINPAAGSGRERLARLTALEAHLTDSGIGSERVDDAEISLYWTEYPGHATEIVAELVRALPPPLVDEIDAPPRLILLSFGGDGTHNEVLRAALHQPAVVTLRVPFGSGNDMADLSDPVDALHTKRWQVVPMPAVRVRGQGFDAVAFNIASIGIDAYITALHTKYKRILPGDSYRLIANLAVLFYERIVGLQPMRLSGGGRTVEGLIMLAAFGASGDRTYGNHMRVLPGPENICVMRHGGLRTKLRLKRLFMAGLHVHEPLAALWQADELTIEYPAALLVQVDGEAHRIGADQFPLRFERLPAAVFVLRPQPR